MFTTFKSPHDITDYNSDLFEKYKYLAEVIIPKEKILYETIKIELESLTHVISLFNERQPSADNWGENNPDYDNYKRKLLNTRTELEIRKRILDNLLEEKSFKYILLSYSRNPEKIISGYPDLVKITAKFSEETFEDDEPEKDLNIIINRSLWMRIVSYLKDKSNIVEVPKEDYKKFISNRDTSAYYYEIDTINLEDVKKYIKTDSIIIGKHGIDNLLSIMNIEIMDRSVDPNKP